MARRDEWFTPRRSVNADNCVETYIGSDAVYVRNSKDDRATTVTFTLAEWRAFVASVKESDDYDV
ncbi:hypothetical protein BJF78_24135 [Pseudonocardia sp. CNS-139]|nr:hypothetical protein BJF78_24135 [Pseudonocardia sp. CNS-139]